VAVSLLAAGAALCAPPAQASTGYLPDSSTPTIQLQCDLPDGVAIDQSSQRIYVAMLSSNLSVPLPGQVERLESTGAPTSASPFSTGSQPFFSGVAVNPLTHNLYAAEFVVQTPIGNAGSSRIDQFSSSGVLGTQFSTEGTPAMPTRIATDSAGNVYFPNTATDTVQVFNSAGTLQQTIACGGCPGGSFNNPNGVAIDSADNLYVVDFANDRVLKFTPSGGSYSFASVLQSGRDAVAVGVDASDNSVFVGDYPGGTAYHIVAYNSSGTQFDDFGAGLFMASQYGAPFAGQIAANTTTHKLYVSDPDAGVLRVFARGTIVPPTASTNSATSVGQVTAKLNATVNANLHATIDCHFEYTDDADFQANVYANAVDTPCPSLPDGSSSTLESVSPTNLTPNTTYHFRVVAANNGGSTNGTSQTFTTLPLTPATVTTGAASAVSQTTATLAGKVNPHGGTVSNCHFEYGEGLTYSKSVPCTTTVGAVTTDVSQSVKAIGLSPNTSYHFRLSVTTNAGTVVGNGEEVTTLPPLPTVTTEAASGIATSGATLNGTINPSGGTSTCRFEYGVTSAYGTVVECPTSPGGGEAPVAEHLNISGLAPGTVYHYRVVGVNAGGTVKGSDVPFPTLSLPPVTPQPLPEPTPPAPSGSTPLKCKKGFQKKKVRGKFKCVKKKKHRRYH